MLGTKFQKPLQNDFLIVYEEREVVNGKGETVRIKVPVEKPNAAPNTLSKYEEASKWCNNNSADMKDMGDHFEVIAKVTPEPTDEELAEQARRKRDALIAETDYLLMPDYPISAENLEAVKAYRQKLRDVPQQEGFPRSIVWPTLVDPLTKVGLAKVGV